MGLLWMLAQSVVGIKRRKSHQGRSEGKSGEEEERDVVTQRLLRPPQRSQARHLPLVSLPCFLFCKMLCSGLTEFAFIPP